MKFRAVVIAALVFLAGGAQSAQTIDFDDVAFPGGDPLAYAPITNGYHGFNWGGEQGNNSWNISPNDATGWYVGAKQPYSHSGDNFAWANGASALELTPPGLGTFDFTSMWARIWPATTASITIRGFLNGNQTFQQTFNLGDTYSQLALNFTHIDRLTIDHQSENVLIDDMDISSVSAVPEPGSYALFAAGVALIGAFCRRYRPAASK